jgi:hypothetical protein
MAKAALEPNTVDVKTLSAITSTTLNSYGVYSYVDEFGNVTQIKRGIKKRLEFYPERINAPVIEPCVIGVSTPSKDCTQGIAMGCGEIGSSTEMVYAKY